MELVFGFGILFGMWLIGRWMDGKIKSIHENELQKSANRDPAAIVAHLRQELREIQIDLRKAKLIGREVNTVQYHLEYCRLLEFAQLLAIDLSVNLLDIRGPLFHEYKKSWTPDLHNKYSNYKEEFTSTGKISKSFVQSIINTSEVPVFADSSEINRQFVATHNSALRFLKLAGVSQ